MNRIQNWRRSWGVLGAAVEGAGRQRRDRLRLRPDVMNLEGRQLLATIDVTTINATGAGSLTTAITQADGNNQANTIEFTGAMFKTARTIFINGELGLSDTHGKQTIEGPAAGVTIDVRVSGTLLSIDPKVNAAMSGLTLTGATGDGSALVNYGTATLSDCTITGNVLTNGSGVTNTGALTLTSSVISHNSTTQGAAGGIFNTPSGTLYATGSTISDNTNTNSVAIEEVNGGGLCNAGTATLANCLVTGNSDTNPALENSFAGGGVANSDQLSMTTCTISGNSGMTGGGVCTVNGDATLTGCTLTGNSAKEGGGFGVVRFDYSAKLLGCTISGNSAKEGAGVYDNGVVMTIENCTIASNSASINGGGVAQDDPDEALDDCTIVDNSAKAGGGGIYSDFAAHAHGCIIAENTGVGGSASNVSGNGSNSATGSYNLIGTGSAGGLTAANHNLLDVADPLLGALGNYGGPTETIPLLPGSPAIGAGEAIAGITTDGRGVARPATDPDIGAFQDQGFSFTITSGGTQTAQDGQPFGTALGVVVKSLAKHPDPVAGGVVTFTADPTGGASASLSTSSATISTSGAATVTATANKVTGKYVIVASVTGTPGSLDFHMTNASASSSDSSQSAAGDQALGAITPAMFGDGTTSKN
jgi:hypothetical protein